MTPKGLLTLQLSGLPMTQRDSDSPCYSLQTELALRQRLMKVSSARGARVPVRLKACLIGEVRVLFRYTLSGL